MISLYIRGLSHVRWLTGIPLLGMIIVYGQCIPFTLLCYFMSPTLIPKSGKVAMIKENSGQISMMMTRIKFFKKEILSFTSVL